MDVAHQEREHPRYAHEAIVTMRVQEGRVFQGRTTNVSRGGLCADLADAVATGSEVDLALQLVFEDEAHSEPLRVPGRVVWCTTVDEGYQVGVAFRQLTPEMAEYLGLFLRYLDDTRPAQKLPKAASVDERFG
ncbi:MAG TPA: PilZ domain-containing protein [Kofleriaceae bacterium]|jgi:Tfp pilus assembly protein PilZ|nr:PilZ domain-containing protein [Kofleriaceae bacterium]